MAHDSSGRIWIGATDLGLLFFRNGVITRFTTSNDVERTLNAIMVLYPDPAATGRSNLILWIGTRSGVDKVLLSLNPFRSQIRDQDGLHLNHGAILSLCEDRTGMLWAGLWGGGLEGLRLRNGRYERVAHFESIAGDPFSLPNNNVGAIH